MSQLQELDLRLPDPNWWILWDAIAYLTCYLATELNNWSIIHPYFATGALLCISGNPELLLTPLRIARYIFILYMLGFRKQGVAKDSYASRYQSRHYGGYVPPQSTFSTFQARGATDDYEDGDKRESTFAVPVSLMANVGTLFVLGRAWGWWY
ncbi:uncharacterized protein F5147DRAFT_729735 [Suillus discolor]|uniref:Uncharacterized protein n=1 Tax=Suillus discolor TaxID=1912936 RepID=A0A9P7ESM1_9AGAM|nr:uncharacterized protein F5147DRAFT_729735 [Suillus discolor]KAG2085818.1 hypothetical protein F5147DRAFT_729735 [Suillus discolor]